MVLLMSAIVGTVNFRKRVVNILPLLWAHTNNGHCSNLIATMLSLYMKVFPIAGHTLPYINPYKLSLLANLTCKSVQYQHPATDVHTTLNGFKTTETPNTNPNVVSPQTLCHSHTNPTGCGEVL